MPTVVDEPALAAFVIRMAEHVALLGEHVVQHADDLRELRGDVLELGRKVSTLEVIGDSRHELLLADLELLNHRLTDVHQRALRALNARYTPKEPA